jgi:SAM-dependent methyltransferase
LLQTSFNNYALEYDTHFTDSLIGKAQRKIVHEYFMLVSKRIYSVLEINCGTGEDALVLSEINKSVVCTDISDEMVNICRNKTKELSNCETILCSIQDLVKNIDKKFNILFSNFGGLNCLTEAELKIFSNDCANLICEKAELVLVIMGRKCLWENFYFFIKGNFKQLSRRRSKTGVVTEIKGSVFQTSYYSPKEIKKIFSHDFDCIICKPLGFFIPPSYLNPFFEKHRFLFSILCKLENIAGRAGFLSNYADHYIIHLKRK